MKNLVSKVSKVFFPALIGFGLITSVASAHMEVTPKTSVTGDEETYTVIVPSEKDIPTIKITVKMPAGIVFDSFEPVAGWNFTEQKGSDGKVKSITYEATRQGILPEEFQRFTFVAKNPDQATKAAWNAYQFYKDGSVVEWTGDEGSEAPHSITDIVSEKPVKQETAQPTKQDTTPAVETTSTPSAATITAKNNQTSWLPLSVAILSATLSVVSLVNSTAKKKIQK